LEENFVPKKERKSFGVFREMAAPLGQKAKVSSGRGNRFSINAIEWTKFDLFFAFPIQNQ
jgi:hypothetical protein